MDTYYEDFEVVHVLDDKNLIDAESYQRSYSCRSRRLTPGYYIVTWPSQPERRRFDDQAEFEGPYPLCVDAWRTRDRLEHEARLAAVAAAAAARVPLVPASAPIRTTPARTTMPAAAPRSHPRAFKAPIKAPVAIAISAAASQAAALLFR